MLLLYLRLTFRIVRHIIGSHAVVAASGWDLEHDDTSNILRVSGSFLFN